MPIAFTVLASGSRGNLSALRLGERVVLVDCGLGPRTTATRLGEIGVAPESITDLVVTHFDRDHVHPVTAPRLAERGVAVHFARRHRHRAMQLGLSGRAMRCFDDDSFAIGDAEVEPVRLAHDGDGSTGYVFERGGVRLGWATDLGRATPRLLERFVALDGVAIESNYDPELQARSGRPPELIRRITGGAGHLSNDQSLRAVRTIAESSPHLAHVVLLHLSEQCNAPAVVRDLWRREAPEHAERLVIAQQRRATPTLRLDPSSRQATLFGRA